MGKLKHLTKKEFKAFILAYSSHVDFKFSEEERNMITKSLPIASATVLDSYAEYDEMDKIEFIVEGVLDHITTKEDVHEFKQALQTQFLADGTYCRFEKCFYEYFSDLTSVVA